MLSERYLYHVLGSRGSSRSIISKDAILAGTEWGVSILWLRVRTQVLLRFCSRCVQHGVMRVEAVRDMASDYRLGLNQFLSDRKCMPNLHWFRCPA